MCSYYRISLPGEKHTPLLQFANVSKPGRNDPCPCGSGKKYKRCCLGRESDREEFERQISAVGIPLLRELGRFAGQQAGQPPETIAAQRFPFWRPPLDKMRAARLLDYLIFDYRPNTYGRNAIEEYIAQRQSIVTPEWRTLLEAWQSVGMELYVLERWSAGFALCRSVLPHSERDKEVMPLESGPEIAPGSAIALRALPVGELFVYASWPTTFGDRSIDDVIESVIARHHAFVRSERIVSMEDFLRLDGTVFEEIAAAPTHGGIIVPGHT